MNLDTFLTSPQDELVDWVTESAKAYKNGDLDLADPNVVTNQDLLFSLALYKTLKNEGLTVRGKGYLEFMVASEAELRRRYATK